MSNQTKSVVVFSTPSCPWCVRVKMYLDNKKIKYHDIDVSVDQTAATVMVQKSQQMGVPQLWIGDEVVVGFDKERIDSLLS